MAPQETPATVAATVPAPRPDPAYTERRARAEAFCHGLLDDAKRAVVRAEMAEQDRNPIDAAMWIEIARSANEDARRTARTIGAPR